MEKHVKQVEFAKLRHAYLTIKGFLEKEPMDNVESLTTTIAEDLSLHGDDNLELLEKFVKTFELNHEGFIYDKHFYSEGELFGSGAAIFNLLNLSLWLPLKTVELLTFNKVELRKPNYYKPDREVAHLTFRDLLTWYIEGEFPADLEIKYEIKTSHSTI